MKKILRILLGLAALSFWMFLLSSCVTEKACSKRFPPTVIIKDSIREKLVYKEKIIYLPGATVHDTMTLIADCPEKGKPGIIRPAASAKVKGKASATTKTEGNKVIVSCNCEDEKAKIGWLEREVEKYKTQTTTHNVTEEVIPWWIYLIIGGLCAIIVFLLKKSIM